MPGSTSHTGFYARTMGPDCADWEPLEEHLNLVADLAAQFAAGFGSAPWGRLLGRWHDLGKYHPSFQERLHDNSVRQGHSGAGAVRAVKRDSQLGGFSPL